MTKKDLIKKLEEYGIVINGYKYQIVIGELRPVSYYLGIYKVGSKSEYKFAKTICIAGLTLLIWTII